ncbi:MAG TPA: SDR family oxidoreductase [Thermoanaerobaculia bacterium]|jgi:NAD(P)-dependent dehydrogenase (short-subunit alcohol dehydrogenase family)|nr:SDR family oxidoreductase [Thermoanaerobaculia bacterium]
MRAVPTNLRRLARPAAILLAGAGMAAAARALRRRPPIQFRDRVAVVTGGSRGLGLLMARELAAEGARLAILARDPAELDLARRELAAISGYRVLAVPCDVGDREEVRWAIDTVAGRFGRLDILINNAGTIQVGPLEHMRVEDFEEALRVHFWGPLYATLAALRHLRQQPTARIVNIASIGGRIVIPHLLPYSASKFALVGLSDGLRAELAKEGIYVTTVCPGLMRTGSHVNARFKGKREEELAWFAVGGALPPSSMSGRRAARRILEACRYGEPSLILTPQARAAAALSALAPNLTARVMELAARLLPGPAGNDGDEARPGWQHTSRWVPSALTRLVDEAAVENNELQGRAAAYGNGGG